MLLKDTVESFLKSAHILAVSTLITPGKKYHVYCIHNKIVLLVMLNKP